MAGDQNHLHNMAVNLFEFQKAGHWIDLLALAAYILLTRKLTAFTVIAVATFVLGFIHMHWQLYVESLYQIKAYKNILGELWYFGFGVSSFLLVILALSICNFKGLLRDKTCNLILYSYLMLGFVQCARYFDRHVIETDVLGHFYKLSIPSINLLVSTLIIFYLLKSAKEPCVKCSVYVLNKIRGFS
jgi:hypothetical protein